MKKHSFKAGDKIKIPTRKTADTSHPLNSCHAILNLKGKDHLWVYGVEVNDDIIVGNKDASGRILAESTFHYTDLELYESPYKYTPEYCRKNKVAFRIKSGLEARQCDDIMGIPNEHGYFYHQQYCEDYCINANKSTNCDTYYYINEGFEVVEASEFIKYNTNMEKTIIFTLKDNKYAVAAANMVKDICGGWWKKGDALFSNKDTWYKIFKENDVLDLWFEPLPEGVIITLSNGKKITIDNSKFVKTEAGTFTKDQLKQLVNPTFDQYKVKFNKDAIVKIGCWGEITIGEIEQIIEKMDKL